MRPCGHDLLAAIVNDLIDFIAERHQELAGALDVYLIDSFELLAGMSFDILNVGGHLMGEYDGLPDGGLVETFSRMGLFITYAGGDGNDVTLYSRAVSEPAAILLALFGLALLLRSRRRSDA